jgi:hypothetical protein
MAGYTSEELQASIDQFLLSTVTTPKTNLGARDVLAARSDIYALLTTTLLLRPDSYFYVIWLAKNRLEALRRQQAAALAVILDPATTASLRRRGKPVTSTAELTNAQAALVNVTAGINQGQGVQTRDLGPEVTRFRNSVERFINTQIKSNVVSNGVPTETAGETRARIASSWATVKTTHEQMLVLCTAIIDAVSNLNSVKLPEQAVTGVVSKLQARLTELTAQLQADKDVSTHREAMLDLLTMRTLLARVSSFRTPQQLLAPLVGDSSQLTGTGGVSPAAIVGTNSGPFNVAPAATLDFESGSPIVPSSITIGAYSNAEAPSRQFTTLPIVFPAGAALRLRVDGVLYPSDGSFSSASYASVALFLTAIQSYLTANVVPATAFSVGTQVFIRSNSSADVSSIEVVSATLGQAAFLVVSGFAPYSVCRGVEAKTIISAATSSPGVRLSEIRTEYFTGNGVTQASSVIRVATVLGTVDTAGGGSSFSAAENIENAGVKVNDFIIIDPTGTAQVGKITRVSGASFDVDVDVSDVGIVAYRVGPDFRGVPAGARVLVGSPTVPLNRGPYRVMSGTIGQITVNRTFFTTSDPISLTVFTSYLQATAPAATSADGITANPSSGGATAVGYTVTPTQTKPGLTDFVSGGTIDFFSRGVGVGDFLTLLTAPSAAVTTITEVFMDELIVEPTPFFAGSIGFTVQSARYASWTILVNAITSFVNGADFGAADFAITRILSGADPQVLLSSFGPVGLFSTQVTSLASIQNYVVPFERTVDNILRMLVEQGFDRAADLFTTLQVVEFFSMHPDGSSYSTNLIRVAADVTRQVAPVSRFAKSVINSPEVRLRSRRMTT